jgi:hypothetical protein
MYCVPVSLLFEQGFSIARCSGKGHVLPLSDWTVEELQKLKVMPDGSRYVLPNADKSAPADPKYITRSVARCLKRFKKHSVAAFARIAPGSDNLGHLWTAPRGSGPHRRRQHRPDAIVRERSRAGTVHGPYLVHVARMFCAAASRAS